MNHNLETVQDRMQVGINLLPSCQSAYRKHYSTETAMLRVWSDIMMAADQRQVTDTAGAP